MARITVQAPETMTKPAAIGGSVDPLDAPIRDWFDWAKGQKSVIAWTEGAVSHLEVNSEDCNAATLSYLLGRGGDVHDAPIFVKMSSAKYQANVPVGIHEREVDDGQGNMVNRKWSEWKDATHNHLTAADGDKIVPGNSWGYELTSDELKVLLGLTGYTLYLAHEVPALLPVE